MPQSVFSKRFSFESQLNDVLRPLTAPPVEELVVDLPLHAYQARALVRLERERLKAAGTIILNSRNRATIIAGAQVKPRPVYILHYGHRSWHPSIASAARATGQTEDSVRKQISDGWAYFDEVTK